MNITIEKKTKEPLEFEHGIKIDYFYDISISCSSNDEYPINIINNIENIEDRVNNLSDYVFEKYSWMKITKKYDSNFIKLVSN